MSGKQYFKERSEKELWELPQDNIKPKVKEIKIDREHQAIAVERHKKMMANKNK